MLSALEGQQQSCVRGVAVVMRVNKILSATGEVLPEH
jgi:hypothetical protein